MKHSLHRHSGAETTKYILCTFSYTKFDFFQPYYDCFAVFFPQSKSSKNSSEDFQLMA